MIDLELQWGIEPLDLPTQRLCEQWVLAALTEAEQQDWAMTLRIVDEDESQQLNRDYRQVDKPTNVLSFPYEAEAFDLTLLEAEDALDTEPDCELAYLGDLVICAEVVAKEALQQAKPLKAHWAHMIVHGTLHLLGYDHIDEAEAEVMEALEVDIMHRLGFTNPYRVIE